MKRWQLSLTRTWFVDAPDILDSEDIVMHAGPEFLNVNLLDATEVHYWGEPDNLEPDFTIEGPEA